MVNVAAYIDEVRDLILALMSRLHMASFKRECEGCTLYHPSQTKHPCLNPVDEEKCTGELIRMFYASNNKLMPNIAVKSVLELHRQLIIYIGSVIAEEIILHFMHNMDLFSYK